MIRTVLIDDEYTVIGTLKNLLKGFDNIDVIGEADGVESGCKLIEQEQPDLILLDIQMKDGTGFDLLRKIGDIRSKIIFITAFDQHAVEAFRFSAVDYLLKPVTSDMLAEAINKVDATMDSERLNLQLSVLMENLQHTGSNRKKIILKESDSVHLVSIEDILWCKAESNYTVFHLSDDREIMVSHTLKEYESTLENSGFYRIHRSYIVNLKKIERFDRGDGGMIFLEGGQTLPVSVRKKDKMMEVLSKIK